jgi:hypothetical protein
MRGNSKRPTAMAAEQWKDEYVPLGGGLEEGTSALAIKPGRFARVFIWEEVFGKQGANTIKGYERYSGLASPSACNYAVQPFDTGTAAIVAGNIVTSPGGASALVVSVTVTTGSFGAGNAVGYLILTSLVDEWADNDLIRVGGVTKALASDVTEVGSIGYGSGHVAALSAAREALRALIAKPVGEGAILGVAVYNEAVYCVRNVAGSTSATLWKSTSTGWSAIKTGLHPGGTYRFEVANFSGATTTIALFGVSSKGRLFRVDSAGVFTFADPIYGSEALSNTNVAYGLGAKTFTSATGSRNWLVGDPLTLWDRANAANYMSGTVSAYNSGTGQLDMNITASTGAGSNAAWEIGLTDFSDKPQRLAAFKDHLFLAYTLGQLQSSNLGDPMTYTSTAALFGLGDDITGLTSLKGEILGIFCRTRIKLLRGSSSLDWDLGDHSKGVGATAETVQDNSGNAFFVDDKGITTLQNTASFGDFDSAIFSKNAKYTLDSKRGLIIGSRMAKGNYQYRLYFSDMTCLRCTVMTGNSVLTPRDVSFSLSEYEHTPTCFANGTLADGLDHMFFGTDDGYVMEEDAGTSFDGANIVYSLQLPYNHFKSPGVEKQFHKLIGEIASPDELTIYIRQLFNYDDGTYGHGGTKELEMAEFGGQWDVSAFDTFQYDRPTVVKVETQLDGVGENMALLIFFESNFVRPVNLQGLLFYFSMLGLNR